MSRTTKKTNSRAGDVVQLAGLVLLGAGVALELAFRTSIWFTVITAGSIIFAVGTKLKRR